MLKDTDKDDQKLMSNKGNEKVKDFLDTNYAGIK